MEGVKDMKKKPVRIISLILAIVMVVAMLPLSALADETYPKQKVALVVYSAEFTTMIKSAMEKDATLDDLKEIAEKFVAEGTEGIQVPQVKATLTPEDETLQKVELVEAEGGFNLFESLQMDIPIVDRVKSKVNENSGIISNLSFVKELKDGIVSKTETFVNDSMAKVFSGLNVYGTIYRVYVADVPVKDVDGTKYTLKVEEFNSTKDPEAIQAGYVLFDGEGDFHSDREREEVIKLRDDDHYQFLASKGSEYDVGLKGDLNPLVAIQDWLSEKDWYKNPAKSVIDNLIEKVTGKLDTSFKFTFPGLWCAESNAGFTFQNTDVADAALMNSAFLMFDRDEIVEILKFMKELGKDAFNELMVAAFGDEDAGLPYDNLVTLHTQLINSDEEGQMSIDQDTLFKIVKTYMAVISNLDLFNRIKDANLVLPAILEAQADEQGLVTFNRQSNITLVWILKILPELKNVASAALDQTGVTSQIPQPLLKLFDYAMDAAAMADDALAEFANGLPYALAQRFGIVGPKMQDDHYIMLQVKAPVDIPQEGKESSEYWLNPLAYTMDVTWKNADWAYVTLADLGIITPYVAEGLYDFVRNTTFEGTVDAFLAKVTRQDDKFVTRALTGDLDVTAALTAYITANVYGPLGLDNVFANKSEFLDGLNEYLYNNGRTTQNLMVYLNKQAKKAKAVYAGNLNPLDEEGNPLLDANGERVYWQFYNVDKSLTIVATKLIKKSADDLAGLIAGDNKVSETKKDVISKTGSTVATIVEKVGTKIEATTAKVTSQIASAAKSVASKLFSSAVSSVKTVATSLFSNIGKLFSKSMITFNA